VTTRTRTTQSTTPPGRTRAEVPTPALLLDLAAARRNIEAMAAAAAGIGAGVRPHVKAHKCAPLAQLQQEAGAVGLTCATVSELAAMAAAGAPDLFLANQVVDPPELDRLAALAGDRLVTVAVDDDEHVARLARAAGRAGVVLGVVVEIDVGMGRAGVRSAASAVRLAGAVTQRPELELRGVHGYEGHCVVIDDAQVRDESVRRANAELVEAAEAVRAAVGACRIVTAGGTATFPITAAHPEITDVQVGSYVLMDSFHERLLPGVFEPALAVAGTVVSRHGSTLVLDVGRKSIAAELGAPTFTGALAVLSARFDEEHCVLEVGGAPPAIGERVEISPAYAPTTVALHDVFHVVEDGVVVDVWPIAPR
jgi:D-serine deaminase-like pyridoxal phosphate-dependent protein